MKFCVGDRVKARKHGSEIVDYIDIYPYENNGGNIIKLRNGYCFHPDECTKLEDSTYEELKERIKAVEGWGKEADDILQEIGFLSSPTNEIRVQSYQIGVFDCNASEWKYFDCNSQCSKNDTFKKILVLILDHSDIKKDEKKEKIKELKEQLKDIEKQVKELERS